MKTKTLPFMLLTDRDAFWDRLHTQSLQWKDMASLVLFIVLACGLYGTVMAGWRSSQLVFYVAVKLPALFLGTVAVVSVFNWMTASLLGSGLSFKSTVLVVLAGITIAAWILLGLIPVALFFLLFGVTSTGTHDELRYAHNSILVTHIIILALAGFWGNATLLKGIRRIVNPRCQTNSLFLLWLTAFAFVGCQLSWILRPFVGSPFYPVAFMRPDCLDRNFYEFVFTEVLPFLFTGGR